MDLSKFREDRVDHEYRQEKRYRDTRDARVDPQVSHFADVVSLQTNGNDAPGPVAGSLGGETVALRAERSGHLDRIVDVDRSVLEQTDRDVPR